MVGFHSSSNGNSFRSYRQKTIYSDWVFSATDNLLGIPGGIQQIQQGEAAMIEQITRGTQGRPNPGGNTPK
jgi:hypothetical protein